MESTAGLAPINGTVEALVRPLASELAPCVLTPSVRGVGTSLGAVESRCMSTVVDVGDV